MTEGYDDEQLKFRAQHGALLWDSVRSGKGGLRIETRKRDAWMSRLFASLTEPQQDAMVEIEEAYRAITSGIGFKTFDPGRIGGRGVGGETARQAQRISDYFTWGRELQRRSISHAMSMAIIAEGMTAAQVDRAYRRAAGTARSNLRAALNAFCKLRGWPQTP